jgi:peptidoglycan/LPS O-acetylase OafA/YrhL
MLKGIPVFFTVSSSALFFYLAGFYFAKYQINFFDIADKIKYFEFGILLILSVILDIFFDGKYGLGSIETIISCLLLLKISKLFIQNEKFYSWLKYLSGYSFFLYAIHAPFISSSINKISQKIIPLHGILCLVQFLIAAILTIILGMLIGIICKKVCPKLFEILNGGR